MTYKELADKILSMTEYQQNKQAELCLFPNSDDEDFFTVTGIEFFTEGNQPDYPYLRVDD